jgi:reverse gyrase
MTHAETNEAVRLSILLGDTRAERHGTYPLRAIARENLRTNTLHVEVIPVPHAFALGVAHERVSPRRPMDTLDVPGFVETGFLGEGLVC